MMLNFIFIRIIITSIIIGEYFGSVCKNIICTLKIIDKSISSLYSRARNSLAEKLWNWIVKKNRVVWKCVRFENRSLSQCKISGRRGCRFAPHSSPVQLPSPSFFDAKWLVEYWPRTMWAKHFVLTVWTVAYIIPFECLFRLLAFRMQTVQAHK